MLVRFLIVSLFVLFAMFAGTIYAFAVEFSNKTPAPGSTIIVDRSPMISVFISANTDEEWIDTPTTLRMTLNKDAISIICVNEFKWDVGREGVHFTGPGVRDNEGGIFAVDLKEAFFDDRCELFPGEIDVHVELRVRDVSERTYYTHSADWSFTVQELRIRNLDEDRAPAGTEIQIRGDGFMGGNSPITGGNSEVLFDGEVLPTEIVYDNRINFLVPDWVSCGGTYTLQIRNFFEIRFGTQELAKSNKVDFKVPPCLAPSTPRPPAFILPQIQFIIPGTGSAGTQVTLSGTGFASDTELKFDGITIPLVEFGGTTGYISSKQIDFTVPDDAACGEHEIIVGSQSNVGVFSNSILFIVDSPCQGEGLNPPLPPGEDPPPTPPPGNNTPPPPPPPPAGEEIEDYDTDGDCSISDIEFFVAADQWIAVTIDDALFFAVLDAWIGEANVCGASASRMDVSIQASLANGRNLLFESQENQVESLAIRIYDLSGQLIFASNSIGSQLSWDLRTSNGDSVSNGVYLYAAAVKDDHGKTTFTKIKKFILVR
jgi:hypothetical protein